MRLHQESNYLLLFKHIVVRGIENGKSTPLEWMKLAFSSEEQLLVPQFSKTDKLYYSVAEEFYELDKGEKPKSQEEVERWLTSTG